MSRFLPLALVLSAAVLMSGCPTPTCTTEAAVSVSVTVVDDAGASIAEATVVYEVDGDEQPCDDMSNGVWMCGYEVFGDITVTATADGYATNSETVTIEQGECHVVGQSVELMLTEEERTAFGEVRRYVPGSKPPTCVSAWTTPKATS